MNDNTAEVIQTGHFQISNVSVEIKLLSTTKNVVKDKSIEIAAQRKSRSWILYEPKFGHFCECAKSIGLTVHILAAIESSQQARDYLHTAHNIPIIAKDTASFLKQWNKSEKPVINGYYTCLPIAISKSNSKGRAKSTNESHQHPGQKQLSEIILH